MSYSVWYTRRQQRVGPLYQGRFGSVLIDGAGAWVLEACLYLHLNPIRVSRLGLGKLGRRAEGRGLAAPTPAQVRERLAVLRGYRWSSYRAYAGYARKPEWLETGEILRRSRGRERLRRGVEGYVRQGEDERGVELVKARVLLGSTAFMEAKKRRVKKADAEQPDRIILNRFVPWERIVGVVEMVRGGKWEEFRDQHGDDRRDLVLYLARERSGMTLREIGNRAGGMDYKSVGKAVERFRHRLATQSQLMAVARKCLNKMSHVET